MAKAVKKGDKVEWQTSQGKTQGTVKKKLTSPTKIKGHKVAASKSNPEYLVESSKSGKEAADKAEALTKVSKKSSGVKKAAGKKSTAAKSTKKTAKKTTAKKSVTAKKTTKAPAVKKSAVAKKTAKPSKATKAPVSKKKSVAAKQPESIKPKDRDEVIREFKSVVNIPPGQLQRWLEQPDSKKVGFKDEKKGESVGHESGRLILKILAKRRDKLSDEDLGHMQKVIGYVHRHLAQKPKGDIVASNWRYSLMNWGHDPTK